MATIIMIITLKAVINDIADAYGKSSDEVNDVVQAMGGAMK